MLRELDKYIEKCNAEEKGGIIDTITETYYSVQKRLEHATENSRKRLFEMAIENLMLEYELDFLEATAEDIFTIFLY